MVMAVCSGLLDGVGRRSFSTIRPCSSTTPAATLVPPTSTPMARHMTSLVARLPRFSAFAPIRVARCSYRPWTGAPAPIRAAGTTEHRSRISRLARPTSTRRRYHRRAQLGQGGTRGPCGSHGIPGTTRTRGRCPRRLPPARWWRSPIRPRPRRGGYGRSGRRNHGQGCAHRQLRAGAVGRRATSLSVSDVLRMLLQALERAIDDHLFRPAFEHPDHRNAGSNGDFVPYLGAAVVFGEQVATGQRGQYRRRLDELPAHLRVRFPVVQENEGVLDETGIEDQPHLPRPPIRP